MELQDRVGETMAYVSQELMERIWQAVATKGLGPVARMQKRHQKEHKALVNFAYVHLVELREDAAGVGTYVFHVIVEAFSRVAPRPGKVRRSAIERAWALPVEELAQQAFQCEPHVAQYLADALAEDDEEVVLSEEERVRCACVLQVVILCLHRACERRA